MTQWASANRRNFSDPGETPISRYSGRQLGARRCESCGAKIELLGQRRCARCITQISKIIANRRTLQRKRRRGFVIFFSILSLALLLPAFFRGGKTESGPAPIRPETASSESEWENATSFELRSTRGDVFRIDRNGIYQFRADRKSRTVDLSTSVGRFTIPFSEAMKLPRFYRRYLGDNR